LYDLEAEEVVDLGPGEAGHFNADSSSFAWVSHGGAGNELRVLDLETREERTLRTGEVMVGAGFLDERRFVVRGVNNVVELIDVETGEVADSDELETPAVAWELQGTLLLMPEPEAPGHF